jgi:eukaryotic-like serine/threonine-protein kinase
MGCPVYGVATREYICMADSFYLEVGRSILSETQAWYKNLQLLGSGGNAATFLVVATSGPYRGVPFAAKIFRKLSKPERQESFLAEMQFLRTCSHPSVMRIFDAGIFYSNPFFVAEYLPNTLEQVIKAGETSIVLKISFALQLLSALAYLEALDRPVIHRDIKPQNIFVKGRSCVLGDFGLMKHADINSDEDREVFKESIGVGMPFRYRTPDQVAYLRNEAALTTKSDIFQVGLVLAELFTGRNPEKKADDFTDEVVLEPLGGVPGSLAGSIEHIIRRMLAFEPQRRDPASRLLDQWEGVFRSAVMQAHALEGRVIW